MEEWVYVAGFRNPRLGGAVVVDEEGAPIEATTPGAARLEVEPLGVRERRGGKNETK